MPVTPLHIGIPCLPSFFKPEKLDIVAAVLGSTLVDLDFFFYLIYRGKIHGFLHTLTGATVLAVVIVVILHSLNPFAIRLKQWFRWETTSSLRSISIGAFLGAYSHIFLDSLIYWDVRPLYPFSDDNPLYFQEYYDQMIGFVYLLASLTTAFLLALWVWKYGKEGKEPQGRKVEKENMENNEKKEDEANNEKKEVR